MSRVALVTGAARGIGAATVAALVDDGWSVVAVDKCADDPRLPYPLGTRAELDTVSAGEDRMAVVADAADAGAMADAVAAALDAFGGLDAVIAAAGVIAGGVPHWELPDEQEEAVFETDLHAVSVAARVGIPALLERPTPRSGRLIAVSSAAAVSGMPNLAAYCAAKAGVEGLVRGLAADLRGTGITANCVAPGSTDTPILAESARLYGLAGAGDFADQATIERLIDPAEVAAAIAFLAGPGGGAASGSVVRVDGGLTL